VPKVTDITSQAEPAPATGQGWASRAGATLEPDTWAECVGQLLSSGSEDALYRGHTAFEWELVSSLERVLEDHALRWDADRFLTMQSMVEDDDLVRWTQDVETALARQFKHKAAHLDVANLPQDWDILGWWEVMQHHGAPTRLLDWTSSPFIALWFAADDHRDGDGDMALWIYDRRTARVNLQDVMRRLRDSEDYEHVDDRRVQNRLLELALDSGTDLLIPIRPRQFQRAIAQQSILTVSPNISVAHPASPWVKRRLATCVRIKEEWKPEILAACQTMGISRFNLFRDLDSLGSSVKESFMSGGNQVPDLI